MLKMKDIRVDSFTMAVISHRDIVDLRWPVASIPPNLDQNRAQLCPSFGLRFPPPQLVTQVFPPFWASSTL